MSMELWNKIAEARAECAELRSELQKLRAEVAAATAQILAMTEERKQVLAELKSMSSRVSTLWNVKDAIEKDAMDLLGRRPPLDPTKVPMPETLKRLGYRGVKP